MLIDLHAHSSGVSRCCRYDYKTILDHAKEVGIDGIVLTNHYQADYMNNISAEEFINFYCDEYLKAASYGEEIEMKVFFGVEVTVRVTPHVHLLIYGADRKFLLENPLLFDMPLKDLHELCAKHGYALVQAHPFRNGSVILDTRYLDGIEINCHPLYGKTYKEELIACSGKTGLTLTCGGDYHGDTYRASCGMYLPEHIKDSLDIAKYILNTNSVKLRVQEPHGEILEMEV